MSSDTSLPTRDTRSLALRGEPSMGAGPDRLADKLADG